MSALFSRFYALTLVICLCACGGSGSVTPQEPRKTPAPIATNEFLNLVKDATCANLKNRLFLIDQKYVMWDKSGSCADASYAQNLYGSSPQNLLCSHADSIAGPRTTCTDTAVESLFKTIIQNLDKADLGLGSTHQVQMITIPTPNSQTVVFKVLSANFHRGVPPDYVLIKDNAAWNNFWSTANIKPSASLMTPDFISKMVLAKFYKTANDCSLTRFLKLSSDGQTLTANFFEEERIAITRCDLETTLNSTPMHMIELQKSDLPLVMNNVSKQLIISRTIANGSYSRIQDARTVVIKDQASWNKLWQEHQADGVAPAQIDFSRKMLISIFLGTQSSGCSGIQDVRIWQQTDKVAVSYYNLEPSANSMCIASITTPFYITEIDTRNEAVEFNRVPTPVQ